MGCRRFSTLSGEVRIRLREFRENAPPEFNIRANDEGTFRSKVLVAKNSDEILGFTAFGFEASELMVAMQTAMLGHLPYTVLRYAIITHPTMSEGLNQLLANVPATK